MNKFNVGDKVIVVTEAEDCWYKTGDVYEISGVNDCSGYGEFEMLAPPHITAVGEDKSICIMLSDVELYEKCKVQETEWTDKHYDAIYKLTEKDIERGWIKIDPYRVSKQWRLGSKDESGALFHVLKTLARIGEKNSVEREVKALLAQIKCFAEIEGVDCE